MANKIKMHVPLVEIDGDEMTRIIWKMIKETLIIPYIDLKTIYFDLGLKNREKPSDGVTEECANAIKKYKVGVKCATITPNAERVKEYSLTKMWKSPNGTIRGILDGTVFRTPITVNSVKPFIKSWLKPITVARHAYGDIYKNNEFLITKPGKAELVFTSLDGEVKRQTIHEFEDSGIILGMHNIDKSIESFAKASFEFALYKKQSLWFSTKETISKVYDRRFKDIFEKVYQSEYKEKFLSNGIEYFYTLIDDAVARIVRCDGGIVWACKNYDGDVFSDMVASAFGSLAMMTSVLVSPNGEYEFEAAHGTVQRHYYKYLKGEKTSTNPMATLFAWIGALKKRGEMDGIDSLVDFANMLEQASIKTIEEGIITGDLETLSELKNKKVVTTEEF